MLRPFEHEPETLGLLKAELARPSFYDEAVGYLCAELGAPAAEPQMDRPRACDDAVQAHWKKVYEDVDTYWTLYELGEKLMDLEDYFRRWRFNHVTTVERVIGFKRGTGGTPGVAYLRKMLEVELFPELWRVRGEL